MVLSIDDAAGVKGSKELDQIPDDTVKTDALAAVVEEKVARVEIPGIGETSIQFHIAEAGSPVAGQIVCEVRNSTMHRMVLVSAATDFDPSAFLSRMYLAAVRLPIASSYDQFGPDAPVVVIR
jgi:hypothetical protein